MCTRCHNYGRIRAYTDGRTFTTHGLANQRICGRMKEGTQVAATWSIGMRKGTCECVGWRFGVLTHAKPSVNQLTFDVFG